MTFFINIVLSQFDTGRVPTGKNIIAREFSNVHIRPILRIRHSSVSVCYDLSGSYADAAERGPLIEAKPESMARLIR